jgi:hypothetical protein
MKTENKLRFGHRVIAWDNDKSEAVKGRFIVSYKDAFTYPHEVLRDDNNEVDCFQNVELDLEATEFVSGDVVEVKLNDGTWVLTEYCGRLNQVNEHLVVYDHETSFKHCRYPQPKKQFIFTDDMTRTQITSMVDEMLKSWRKE